MTWHRSTCCFPDPFHGYSGGKHLLKYKLNCNLFFSLWILTVDFFFICILWGTTPLTLSRDWKHPFLMFLFVACFLLFCFVWMLWELAELPQLVCHDSSLYYTALDGEHWGISGENLYKHLLHVTPHCDTF